MRRKLWLAAALLALAVGLAGCGGGGGGTLSFDPKASAARTQDAGSAKVAFDTSAVFGGQSLDFDGTGVVDFQRQRAQMTFDVGDLAAAFGQGASGGGGQMRVVSTGLVVYMSAPFLRQVLPQGKTWMKLDLEALSRARGINLGSFRQLSQNDPSQILSFLRGTSGEVKKVGGVRVRGVDTTHYRARVDLDRVASQAPESARPAIRESIRSLKQSLRSDKIPVDVWIDAKGLVRRMKERLEVTQNGMTGRIAFTMDLFAFGTPVQVEVPPPADVVDVAQFLQAQQGGAPTP